MRKKNIVTGQRNEFDDVVGGHQHRCPGVGFSLGILNQKLFMVAIWIGIVAAATTWLAMKIRNRLLQKFGNRIEIIGGLILMIMALKLWLI